MSLKALLVHGTKRQGEGPGRLRERVLPYDTGQGRPGARPYHGTIIVHSDEAGYAALISFATDAARLVGTYVHHH